jgi:uncharacterized circularly permuted ATP-grasp superfamily protein
VFPAEILAGSRNFRPQCVGRTLRFGVWARICGTDLVRDRDGTVYVPEDNPRVPSEVAYMLQNVVVLQSDGPSAGQGPSGDDRTHQGEPAQCRSTSR